MQKIIYIILGVFFLFGNGVPVFTQNSERWQEAQQKFIEKKNSSNPAIRAKIANQLAKATYPAVEYDTAKLLVDHIKNEIERSKGIIDLETQIRYEVIEACVNGLKIIKNPKAVEYLIKSALDEKLNWRLRFYVIQSLSEINTPEVVSVLVKLIDDANIPVKISTLHVLTTLKVLDAIQRACKLLNEDNTWEVKVAAIKYLDIFDNQDLIEPLINTVQDNMLDGCVKIKIVALLKKLTNEDFGFDSSAWLRWWEKKIGKYDKEIERKETISMIPTSYYGITVTSSRMIFLMDTSGSMEDPASGEETMNPPTKLIIDPPLPENKDAGNPELVARLKELKQKSDGRKTLNRMIAAQKELVNTIYNLDPAVEFTMVFFSNGPVAWKDVLVTANLNNKIAAIEYVINNVGPLGGTAIYEALEYVHKFVGRERKIEKPKSGYQNEKSFLKDRIVQFVRKSVYTNEFGGPDTIFMVTDGAPTVGRLIDKLEIINEFKKISQIRGITINTVAIGEAPLNPNALDLYRDVDTKFLAELATSTGGIFTDKTSKPKNKPAKNKE
jgi:hypothetical protein